MKYVSLEVVRLLVSSTTPASLAHLQNGNQSTHQSGELLPGDVNQSQRVLRLRPTLGICLSFDGFRHLVLDV